MSDLTQQIETWISDLLKEHDLYLVDVKVLPNNKVQVFIDGDQNVTIQQCTIISRHLEPKLDDNEAIPANYNLEVSSPGMTQPIKVLRQYKKRIGRELAVTLNDGNQHTGTLESYDDQDLHLKVKDEIIKIKHDDIKKSIVQFKFSKVK